MSQGSWAIPCRYIHEGMRLFIAILALGLYACGGSESDDDVEATGEPRESSPQEIVVTPQAPFEEVQADDSEEPRRSIRRLEIETRSEVNPIRVVRISF